MDLQTEGGRVSLAYVRSLLDYLRERYSLSEVFGQRLAQRLDSEDSRGNLPVLQWVELFRQAIAVTGDRRLPLRVGQAIKPRHYGLLGYVTMSCDTLGEAIDRLVRFERLVGELSQSQLVHHGELAELRWRSPLKPYPPPELAETALAAWVTYARWILGEPVAPDEVHFQHPCSGDDPIYREVFDAPVRFESAHTAVVFPAAFLDLPLAQADAQLKQLLDAQAERQLQELREHAPELAAVVAATRQAVENGSYTLAAVAKRMGCSPRTLQRLLADHGTTFQAVLDETRRRLAEELIAAPHVSLAEVAFVLGYSEQSAFQRAFKRWTGYSPGAWRRQRNRDRQA